jgi:hypothetical protein
VTVAEDQTNPVDPFASEKYESPTLAAWAKQAAGKDVDTMGQIAKMAYGTAQIPQRAIEAAQGYQIGNPDTMNPAPFVDAAMLTMGAGAPMAEAGALGSAGGKLGTGAKAFLDTEAPVDIWKVDPAKLMPGQKVSAGPGGNVGTFKGVSPAGTVLVDWKAGATTEEARRHHSSRLWRIHSTNLGRTRLLRSRSTGTRSSNLLPSQKRWSMPLAASSRRMLPRTRRPRMPLPRSRRH